MFVIRAGLVCLLCLGVEWDGVEWRLPPPRHLDQTTSDMANVVGSLDSRESYSNCLFCFYGFATIVIKMCLSLKLCVNKPIHRIVDIINTID